MINMVEGKKEKIEEKIPEERLNKQELVLLINTVSQVKVQVNQSQKYVMLINKMSRMIDEIGGK